MANIDHVEENDIPIEPVMRDGEYIAARGRNNQLIIFGRDRPGDINSGYGSQKKTGSIHIVVGRKEQNVNLMRDSAFIYMSMKTDVDANVALNKMTDGSGKTIDSRIGSGIIIKSSNIRLIHRDDGDVRVSSADGKNYIILQNDRCEIRLGKSWLKIDDGTITVAAGTIKLGDNASMNRVILGDDFMNTVFNLHTHQSPVGPTSLPLLQMTEKQLSQKSHVE